MRYRGGGRLDSLCCIEGRPPWRLIPRSDPHQRCRMPAMAEAVPPCRHRTGPAFHALGKFLPHADEQIGRASHRVGGSSRHRHDHVEKRPATIERDGAGCQEPATSDRTPPGGGNHVHPTLACVTSDPGLTALDVWAPASRPSLRLSGMAASRLPTGRDGLNWAGIACRQDGRHAARVGRNEVATTPGIRRIGNRPWEPRGPIFTPRADNTQRNFTGGDTAAGSRDFIGCRGGSGRQSCQTV